MKGFKKKQARPTICCLQETYFKYTHRLKVKQQGGKGPSKWKPKESRIAILLSDKTDFQPKTEIRDNEGYYIITKGLIQQEDKTFINIYALNMGEPRYRKQILTHPKGEIDSNIQ